MTSRFIAALLTISVLSPLAYAELRTVQSRFYKIETDIPDKDVKAIAEHMDAVYSEYNQRFRSFPQKDRAKRPLWVFATQEGYLRFLGQNGINGSGSAGMFFITPSIAGLAIFIEGRDPDDYLSTLRHEGFHQFASARIGRGLPVWANEGMAEYFSEAIVVDGKLTPGQVPPQKIGVVRQAVESGKSMSLEQLLNMPHAEWNFRVQSGRADLQYPQSWTVVHFLVHGSPRFQKSFVAYLMQIAKGQNPDKAYETAFGKNSYNAFEKAWAEYVNELEPNPEVEAASRLQFLATGLKFLARNGAAVDSLDNLKAALRTINFRYRVRYGSGLTDELDAKDDKWFEAPNSGDPKKPTTLEMGPAEGDVPLPTLVVKGLKFTVMLKWGKGPDGTPVAQIEYDK